MLNKSIIIGRMVTEPELQTTKSGVEVCSFRIAVDRDYTPKGGEKQTDFLNIVAWRHNAKFVSSYFNKGKLIGIEGSIQSRDYTDKEGNKRYAVEVVADRCFFVGDKSDNNLSESKPKENLPNSGVSYSNGKTGDFQVIDTDDLPF